MQKIPNPPDAARRDRAALSTGPRVSTSASPEGRAAEPESGCAMPQITATGAMAEVVRQARQIAETELTTLITGESGTGKTTIARLIHASGPRAGRPFVVVNCASLPRELIEAELFGHARGAFTGAVLDRAGRVEMANGGTLLLDEIGDLPRELQPKLLTFLQDQTFQRIGSDRLHCVDVRVIGATNQDLIEACQEKRFREDLYFRLNVLNLHLPPLRERRGCLPELVAQILTRIGQRNDRPVPRVHERAMFALIQHDWPGNVRELENVLQRACVFCEDEEITEHDLRFDRFTRPAESGDAERPASAAVLAGRTLAEIEKQALIETLEACRGNKAMAARNLGISERSIYNKLKRHEL